MPGEDKSYNNIGLVEDGSLERLLKRLQKGMILKTRIVYCLGNNRYLLRIYGHNLIMQSAINFNRFDEIEIEIKQVAPKLIVQVVDPSRKDEHHNRRMDIII